MSKFLWNVLKISGSQMPQMNSPGCAPAADGDTSWTVKHITDFF